MTAAQVNESARQNLRLLRIGSATDVMVTSPSRDTYLRGAQEYSDSYALSYTQGAKGRLTVHLGPGTVICKGMHKREWPKTSEPKGKSVTLSAVGSYCQVLLSTSTGMLMLKGYTCGTVQDHVATFRCLQ